jgi:hypothetical protein
MKNTTLGRKPANTMKSGVGETRPRNRSDVKGSNMDFAFNGQAGSGVNRESRDVCYNPMAHLVKNPDAINHGLIQANRTGNASDSYKDRMEGVGPSATGDAHKRTVATASQARNPIESESGRPGTKHSWSNPDAIYVGKR